MRWLKDSVAVQLDTKTAAVCGKIAHRLSAAVEGAMRARAQKSRVRIYWTSFSPPIGPCSTLRARVRRALISSSF